MKGQDTLRGAKHITTKEIDQRIDYLRTEADEDDPEMAARGLDSDDEEELADLVKLEEMVSEGETLIHEDEMKEYAQQLCEDMHGRDALDAWPFCCVDWDQAVEMLRADMTAYEFCGDAYYSSGH